MIDSATTFALAPLHRILEEFKLQKGAIIPILQRVQDTYGYLPKEILAEISKRMHIPLTQLMGVATFYAQFRLTPRGKHLIRVCDGTACHVSGAPGIVRAIEKKYDMPAGSSSSDYKYTLEVVYCVGACGLAPVVIVDDKVYGKLSPDAILEELRVLE